MAKNKRKKKKSQTIGELCGSRMTWHIKPTTQVVEGKKKKNDRKEVKKALKNGNYDD